MTRYEALHAEQRELRARRTAVLALPTLAALTTVLIAGFAFVPALGLALAAVLVVPFACDRLLRAAWPAYRGWATRAAEIGRAIADARRGVTEVFGRFRERRRGEPFKSAYELAGRTTRELETALAVGMHREGREVFVTAFMREGRALRVTASIGSPFRCSAADDPARWRDHLERLGCDEVRQYHNHPEHGGHTRPSATDIRSTGRLRKLLDPHADTLRSYVICWNPIREWKVFGYDHRGKHWLEHEHDALDAPAG